MKSYKREAGGAVLLAAAIISARFWTLDDPALVSAFGGAYGAAMFSLVPTGLVPFGMHFITMNKDGKP